MSSSDDMIDTNEVNTVASIIPGHKEIEKCLAVGSVE